MPRVDFTPQLRRHVDCPAEEASGATVREALEAYFVRHPRARSYVLDEQGELRRHVTVFVDGTMVQDRRLAQALGADSEILVMQALSGG